MTSYPNLGNQLPYVGGADCTVEGLEEVRTRAACGSPHGTELCRDPGDRAALCAHGKWDRYRYTGWTSTNLEPRPKPSVNLRTSSCHFTHFARRGDQNHSALPPGPRRLRRSPANGDYKVAVWHPTRDCDETRSSAGVCALAARSAGRFGYSVDFSLSNRRPAGHSWSWKRRVSAQRALPRMAGGRGADESRVARGRARAGLGSATQRNSMSIVKAKSTRRDCNQLPH